MAVTYRHLSVRREDAVEHLDLNRPDVRNALDDEMIAELTAWAAAVDRDPAVRSVVLGGKGPSFCGGADARWMAKTAAYSEEANMRDAAALARLFASLDRLPLPLVGRIHGAAIGGGAGLAAVCDVVIAAEDAVFGFPEVRLGLIPAVIAPFVIAKIGRSAARELFVTGSRFSAARAREIGLVHKVVPASELDEATAQCVREIAAGAPGAIAAAKALIANLSNLTSSQAADITARAIAERRVSEEGQEGLRAFLDKRPPVWRG